MLLIYISMMAAKKNNATICCRSTERAWSLISSLLLRQRRIDSQLSFEAIARDDILYASEGVFKDSESWQMKIAC